MTCTQNIYPLLVILIIISCSSQENNLDEYLIQKKRINFEENLHGYNIFTVRIDGWRTLQVKSQLIGLKDKINLPINLLKKINIKNV